ncbi:hypothetical protein [Streptomyces sp. NPDC001389]|uniref:hypothetical protein n=1 Tax=Streptomyces sp. NPDC001389 TaxID=3364569 RepID=UPI0036C487F6
MAGEAGGGLASQMFTLAKDLAKVEKEVEALGARGAEVQASLAGLDLGPVQEAIDHLEDRTSGLQVQVQALSSIPDGLAALTKAVKAIREDLEALAAEPAEEKLAVWNWAFQGGMNKEEAGDAWQTLVGWVRSVLQGQYEWVGPPATMFAKTGYGSISGGPVTPPRIPPCWYRHREAVIELSWLCQEWIKIYTTSYGTPARAGDWHDRYAPGVKRRVIAALSVCGEKGTHVDAPWMTDRNHENAPRAIDDDAALSTWVGWDLQHRPDAPAAGPVEAS